MSSWFPYFVTLSYGVIYYLFLLTEKRHRREVEGLHEAYKDERQQLLDRIMANNIQEFKTANGLANVKKSESGNFLLDRMNATAKKHYLDE